MAIVSSLSVSDSTDEAQLPTSRLQRNILKLNTYLVPGCRSIPGIHPSTGLTDLHVPGEFPNMYILLLTSCQMNHFNNVQGNQYPPTIEPKPPKGRWLQMHVGKMFSDGMFSGRVGNLFFLGSPANSRHSNDLPNRSRSPQDRKRYRSILSGLG